MSRPISHVIGFDDAPFDRAHRGDVLLVGVVYSNTRLEGVLSGKVRRDGVNATARLIELISQSRFLPQIQGILVQGIAFAGFNVVDIWEVYEQLDIPVLAISRKAPDMAAVRSALLEHVPGGRRKWRLIEKAGPMEPAAGVFVQRAGIGLDESALLIRRLAVNSALPEPLRTAHLIAGGIEQGESRHRA